MQTLQKQQKWNGGFLKARCCVEETLLELQLVAKELNYFAFRRFCLCLAPEREWQCWPRGFRAGVLLPPADLELGTHSTLKWQVWGHPWDLSGALWPLHRHLDLNTEKPSFPWVGEAHKAVGFILRLNVPFMSHTFDNYFWYTAFPSIRLFIF